MGRFGTCVSVQDLDRDGFEDVVVGAPSEDGCGAVHLYRGGESGVRLQPSQTILASQIHPQLKGFGFSISRAVDVDDNKYFGKLVFSFVFFKALPLCKPTFCISYTYLYAYCGLCELTIIKANRSTLKEGDLEGKLLRARKRERESCDAL